MGRRIYRLFLPAGSTGFARFQKDWKVLLNKPVASQGYLRRLYPGQFRNSENSRHTACSWASRVARRSHSHTRLSPPSAHHDRGSPASPGYRCFRGYHLCQGCPSDPAGSYQTGKKREKRWVLTFKNIRGWFQSPRPINKNGVEADFIRA